MFPAEIVVVLHCVGEKNRQNGTSRMVTIFSKSQTPLEATNFLRVNSKLVRYGNTGLGTGTMDTRSMKKLMNWPKKAR